MPRVAGDIVIRRPAEDVFDFVADERNEPRFNPRLSNVEIVSGEPIGAGTRFRAETASGGRTVPMTVEFTEFERPARLSSVSRVGTTTIAGALTFEPHGEVTVMRWRWDVHLPVALRPLGPIVGWLGARQERRIWGELKRLLER